MSKKECIKRIVGERNIHRIRKINAYIKYLRACYGKTSGKFQIIDNHLKLLYQFGLADSDVFFGYYDLQQLNRNQDKLLVHAVKKGRGSKPDPAGIYWIDLETGIWHKIAETFAWSWQQGSRLRWHPLIDNYVLFNNLEDNHYVTQMWDIDTGKKVRSFSSALYDITSDFKYGLYTNFSRLQRLRPGYGYSVLQDTSIDDYAPENEGLFRLNLETGKSELLFSLRQLSESVPEANRYQHYMNHISISPDGKRFMFFHLWTQGPQMRWKLRCNVAEIDGANLRCLESKDVISHYCWKDSQTLLTTKINHEKSGSAYALYNVQTGEKQIIHDESLIYDGHPAPAADAVHFIADTYPLDGGLQHLFRNTYSGADYRELLIIYSDPRLVDERRCDLHPRLSKDNRIITVDSAYRDLKREVLVFEIDPKEGQR